MNLALRPRPLGNPGQNEGPFLAKETPRIGAPFLGFFLEAAISWGQRRRLLFNNCFREPRLGAAFCTRRRELEEDTKTFQDHSKYFSIVWGGSAYMTPTKLRIRASSKGPRLLQSQKALLSLGRGEEALQENTLSSMQSSSKGKEGGSESKRAQVKGFGKSKKGSLSVPPLSGLEPRKRHNNRSGKASKTLGVQGLPSEEEKLFSPLATFLRNISHRQAMQSPQPLEGSLPSRSPSSSFLEHRSQAGENEYAQT
ncbi:hypothetical protein NDU88_001759 [Pleurodeles waltl]|uniref:Uncharacterized protein n=1 Tax=Pleurodeles waltl TaxID=8319 RepID=A0AAV7V8P7_PLEWA|nr:hypothetical protein NDU88_001759 [Pleurodeles waltl]